MSTSPIDDDFLLSTAQARQLYHEHIAGLPIIDYHCHLDAEALADDRSFADLTELWVASDPYKHRAMRIAGVPERCITGDAGVRQKYDCWAATLPKTLGNPLHHWSALELRRCFEIEEPLTPSSADRVWRACNTALADPSFSARGLLGRRNVACVCTSDALLDDLAAHERLAASDFSVRVLPSLRADDALAVEAPGFTDWVGRLAGATGRAIDSLDTFLAAVDVRLEYFDAHGCRLADHGLDAFVYRSVADGEAEELFRRRIAGEPLNPHEAMGLRSGLLRLLATRYAKRGWVLQLHLGAQRYTSTRLRRLAGPAGGYATIGNACDVPSLCRLLDDLELAGGLPRSILYPLNPCDYAALATITGSYAEDGVPGKLQLGPAWWFNDHRFGIAHQLSAVANYSLLWTFVGMTTDSRSLLSMVRHEYFRRVLCEWLGRAMRAGELPDDVAQVGQLARLIACDNARSWVLGEEEMRV